MIVLNAIMLEKSGGDITINSSPIDEKGTSLTTLKPPLTPEEIMEIINRSPFCAEALGINAIGLTAN